MTRFDEQEWASAWDSTYPSSTATGGDAARRRRRFTTGRPPLGAAVIASAILVGMVVTGAVAATGDALRESVRNGTTRGETEIIGDLGATTTAKGGYVTRQSNLSSSGGGAIYGCRSKAGGSGANPPQNPCVRASNLSTGHAFEFNSNDGGVVGAITAGAGGDSKRPFTTNATGVATGLNADRVDSLDAAQIIAAARAKAGLVAESADTATNATNAADAATLDGIDSPAFVQHGAVLPSGAEMRGIVGGRYQNGPNAPAVMGATASFPIPVPVELDNAHIEVGPSANCNGSTSDPVAAPGYVCIYPSISVNANNVIGHTGVTNTTNLGFQMDWSATAANTQSSVRALWAYTAP